MSYCHIFSLKCVIFSHMCETYIFSFKKLQKQKSYKKRSVFHFCQISLLSSLMEDHCILTSAFHHYVAISHVRSLWKLTIWTHKRMRVRRQIKLIVKAGLTSQSSWKILRFQTTLWEPLLQGQTWGWSWKFKGHKVCTFQI